MESKDIQNTDLLLHCSLSIEYAVGGRKGLFNISYDFGTPPKKKKTYMLAPKEWEILLIMPELSMCIYVCISLLAHRES